MNLTPAEVEMLTLMHESSRIAHTMAREFSRDYRDAVALLKYRQAANGWSDLMYRNVKNGNYDVADALSRSNWWTNEANRIDAEIQIELGLLAVIEDPALRPLPELASLREQRDAHRVALTERRKAVLAAREARAARRWASVAA